LLKSITSYTDYENNIPTDFDYSPSVYNIGGFDDWVESVTQEIVLSSNYDSAFQWTAGAYYSKDENFWSFWIYNATVADNSGRPIVETEFGPYVIFDGTPLVSTETNLGGAFADSTWIDTTAKAVFFHGEFSVSDDLRFIAGLRYNDEEKYSFGGGSNFTAGGAPVTQLFINGSDPAIIPQTRLEAFAFDSSAPGASSVRKNYDNTTWKAGIVYDLNDDAMVYATASTGFLSGAVNNNGTGTDEQESEMFEIGAKSILMEGTLLLNVAAHHTEYTNLLSQFQTVFIDPDTGVETVLTSSINGGDIEARGLEVEMQYLPTREWSLGLVVTFLDAEFGEFGQTGPYQFNRGVPTEFESLSGETPGWSPDLVFNFFADYTFSLDSGATLTPGLMFMYSDSYNTSNLYVLDPNHDQDSYTKTDLRLTWLSPSRTYMVVAFIENIEDEAVLSRGNSGSQDPVTVGYLYPRNYGVMFQARWQ
jgi:iron complex outermembrane receptor protein